MTFIAAIFNITPAAVPAKGELPHESEPAQVEGNEWVRSRYSLLSPFLAFKNAEAYYSFIK